MPPCYAACSERSEEGGWLAAGKPCGLPQCLVCLEMPSTTGLARGKRRETRALPVAVPCMEVMLCFADKGACKHKALRKCSECCSQEGEAEGRQSNACPQHCSICRLRYACLQLCANASSVHTSAATSRRKPRSTCPVCPERAQLAVYWHECAYSRQRGKCQNYNMSL